MVEKKWMYGYEPGFRNKEMDALNFHVRMSEIKKTLVIGKKYKLYRRGNYANGSRLFLIHRTLVGIYPHHAVFQDAVGLLDSYTFSELVLMMKKPDVDKKVYKESDMYLFTDD